jgi:outer membrane cobalamin receptor
MSATNPPDGGSSTQVKATAPVVEQITVTAERFERPIDLTPQSVTVLDVKEIHTRPMWNVEAIIADVPGISYQRSGGLDGQMVVRGLSSNDPRTVLFIDGTVSEAVRRSNTASSIRMRLSASRSSAALPLRSMVPTP